MEKVTRLREYMAGNKIDGVLITSVENMQWYSGFSGDTAQVLVTMQDEYFITDSRYLEMAEKELGNRFTYIKERTDGAVKGLDKRMGKGGFKCLAIEMDKVTLSQKKAFDDAWLVNYVAIDTMLAKMRSKKTQEEIARMREGAKIVEDTFSHLLKYIKEGATEFDILAEMQYCMNKHASRPSFTPIIAAGPNSSLPHATTTNRKLMKGDFLTMDFGVVYKGLCTDFTRTIAIGGVEEALLLIYNVVKTANLHALQAVRAGAMASEVDAAARDTIKDAGYSAYFEHGTGHGVGVEIHEAPFLSPRSEEVLEEGMVVTVEPGIYLPGRGGVRIEDMIAVTQDGCENFYTVTKDLIIIG